MEQLIGECNAHRKYWAHVHDSDCGRHNAHFLTWIHYSVGSVYKPSNMSTISRSSSFSAFNSLSALVSSCNASPLPKASSTWCLTLLNLSRIEGGGNAPYQILDFHPLNDLVMCPLECLLQHRCHKWHLVPTLHAVGSLLGGLCLV